jgi:VCBS repeat-containing protein
VTYTPAANYSGADNFTFRVNDGATNSTAATVAITVTAANDAPVANAQSVTATEDTAKAITLTGSDAEGSALTYAIITAPAHGTLTGTVPNVTYTPAANYNGADSFTFRVNDGTNNSAAATVSITVSAANDVPVAGAQSVTAAEDTAKSVTLTGSDIDGDALTYAIVTSPAHGTLAGTAPNVTYTPAANYNGADSFTFRVSDGATNSAAATVSITVNTANDAPAASAQSVATTEDAARLITLTGSDPEGSALTFAIVSSPAHGTLSGSAPNVTYQPAANYYGPDSFAFRVNDGVSNSAPATVAINVTAVNDAPVAVAQSLSATHALARAITLTAGDADGDALDFSIVSWPAHGTLSGTPPNVVYSAETNYAGADSFTFVAGDGLTDSAPATVAITVTTPDNLPLVSVTGTANAAEPKKSGAFVFTRTGDSRKSITVNLEFDGTAQAGVDYVNPGTRITFKAGKTNVTLAIKPISDGIFDGSKTLVATVVGSTNYDAGEQGTDSILINDDDRPRITISADTGAATNLAKAAAEVASRSEKKVKGKISAAAIPGFTLVLQCSTDLVNWVVVAAPPLAQPVDYTELDSASTPTRYYRVLYVFGEVTEANIATALAYQMFSANTVGVVDVPLQPGWNLAANPLNGKLQDGPLGDVPEGSVFVQFKSSRLNTFKLGKWIRGVPLTRSTTGGWFFNPLAEPITITYTGEVPDLAKQPRMPSGWNVRSTATDTAVSNDEILGYPLFTGDALYEFNPAGTGAGIWIPHFRGMTGWDSAPELRSGQGVLIYKNKSAKPRIITAPTVPASYFNTNWVPTAP